MKKRSSNPSLLSIFLTFFAVLCLFHPSSFAIGPDSQISGIHTLGATDSLQQIAVEAVYYLPADSEPLPDWQERIDYLMRRAQKFHRRELTGQSDLTYRIYPEPFISSATAMGFPQDDPNNFFWQIVNEVWHSGKIKIQSDAFPIILVFSDHNYSPSYDDWTRECRGVGCLFPEPHSDCAGHVKSNGEDRPGSRCGGSRALFWPEMHIGLGLVTADGWKVPLLGSDCVVYHEGIGHSIGLPHPEPIDDSVMGLAQYVDGIHLTWLNENQKLALGWEKKAVDRSTLFSTFNVEHSPHCPSATEPVQILATFPIHFHPNLIRAEYQTALREPFQRIDANVSWQKDNYYNFLWTLPPVEKGKSIAYRIRVETEEGQQESIWHYYKIR